jgi:hypothetical protein
MSDGEESEEISSGEFSHRREFLEQKAFLDHKQKCSLSKRLCCFTPSALPPLNMTTIHNDGNRTIRDYYYDAGQRDGGAVLGPPAAA